MSYNNNNINANNLGLSEVKAEEREGSVRKVPIFLFSTDSLFVQRDSGEGDMRGLLEVRTEKGKGEWEAKARKPEP